MLYCIYAFFLLFALLFDVVRLKVVLERRRKSGYIMFPCVIGTTRLNESAGQIKPESLNL